MSRSQTHYFFPAWKLHWGCVGRLGGREHGTHLQTPYEKSDLEAFWSDCIHALLFWKSFIFFLGKIRKTGSANIPILLYKPEVCFRNSKANNWTVWILENEFSRTMDTVEGSRRWQREIITSQWYPAVRITVWLFFWSLGKTTLVMIGDEGWKFHFLPKLVCMKKSIQRIKTMNSTL